MNLTRIGFKNRWCTLVYMQSRNITRHVSPGAVLVLPAFIVVVSE